MNATERANVRQKQWQNSRLARPPAPIVDVPRRVLKLQELVTRPSQTQRLSGLTKAIPPGKGLDAKR